ncbi:MAG: energy transducer TonB, partial [Bacteroidales bacterium]|nr:energy transducer TonB [Bacteroidales bacterium]
MESKKSDKANLENKKSIFLQIGIVVAIMVSLVAFEWTTGERGPSAFDGMSEEAIEEEQIPVTEEQPPEEVPPPEVTVTDLFEIVEDDV